MLSIVIVNWNSGALLGECLASLPASIAGLGALDLPGASTPSIIVVDNGSTDGSIRSGSVTGLAVDFIRNRENRGFAAACNQGAAAACEPLILFLNPDTRLYADSLRAAVQALMDPTHAQVGIVGVALDDDRGNVARSCARFPRAYHYLNRALGIDRLWPQLGHPMLEWDHRDSRCVDQVIGAFFMIRRSLFESLGGFDERFFVYLEEVDLSLRASQQGWASLYLANARAYHKGGGTTDAVRGRRLFYSWSSRLQYTEKHHGPAERFLLRLVTWVLEPLSRCVQLLLLRRWGELGAVAQAYGWLLRR
jgi:N-acetylglucosaminyl-diphospho-decaprenol L-rhamnosyltransferase